MIVTILEWTFIIGFMPAVFAYGRWRMMKGERPRQNYFGVDAREP